MFALFGPLVFSVCEFGRLYGLPCGSGGKESTGNAGGMDSIPGQEDPLEKGMATHSNILAWRIPRTEEPGRPQSMGSQKSWTQLSV